MKTKLKTCILTVFALATLATLFTSCDKINDLVDPKYGDEELVDLMTSGRWNIDSLHKKYEEQGRIITDSNLVNYGEFEFINPKNKKSPSALAGYLVRHYKNKQDVSVTDTSAWYPGNATSSESIADLGKKMTIYYTNDKREGYVINAEKAVFDFVKKDKKEVIIEGWHRVALSNGATIGTFRRYKLSR